MAFFIPFLLGGTVFLGAALALTSGGGGDKRNSDDYGRGRIYEPHHNHFIEIYTDYGHYRTTDDYPSYKDVLHYYSRLINDQLLQTDELQGYWQRSGGKGKPIPEQLYDVRINAVYLYQTNESGTRKTRLDYWEA